ncbi:hypothetical protein GIB67_039462 [Kingdonia uniflora]|uniref:Aminotransferase-like plant mobile domain-containing protein n=1 Tax=Kingdonia uniflora TaxID=39325 RepID=A0A7J7LIY4_9MAGN|nr:hypothetical protein GIB67_039462 [Kingdonia uniflora]
MTTVVPPNTVEECPTNTVEECLINTVKQSPQNTIKTANEGVPEHSGAHIEDDYEVRVSGVVKIESESAQATLGAQPTLPTDGDINIDSTQKNCEHSSRRNSVSKTDANNDEVALLILVCSEASSSIEREGVLRVHHHPSTWDLTKEQQMVQDLVKLKSLHRIGAISYDSYNFSLIYAFVECLQQETNNFYFKWGEMTPTLDDMEQQIGFTSKGNSLSLKKLRDHYAYKLEKVLNDGTTVKAKKKGLTTKSVARAYMLYILGSFLFPIKKGTDVVWDPYKDKRDFTHGFKEITYFYGTLASPYHVQPYYTNRVVRQFSREQDDDDGMFEIHQKNQAPQVNEDGDTPVDHYEAGSEQYHASLNEHATLSPNAHDTMPTRAESCGLGQQIKALNGKLQKLKEDKDQKSETNIKLAEALKEKILECKNLQDKNGSFEVELKQKSGLEECNVSLSIELNKKRKKLVNAEEMKKSLEVNNNEWEVWHQALKKALTSEGM